MWDFAPPSRPAEFGKFLRKKITNLCFKNTPNLVDPKCCETDTECDLDDPVAAKLSGDSVGQVIH